MTYVTNDLIKYPATINYPTINVNNIVRSQAFVAAIEEEINLEEFDDAFWNS